MNSVAYCQEFHFPWFYWSLLGSSSSNPSQSSNKSESSEDAMAISLLTMSITKLLMTDLRVSGRNILQLMRTFWQMMCGLGKTAMLWAAMEILDGTHFLSYLLSVSQVAAEDIESFLSYACYIFEKYSSGPWPQVWQMRRCWKLQYYDEQQLCTGIALRQLYGLMTLKRQS